MQITITLERNIEIDDDFTAMYTDYLVANHCLEYFCAANRGTFDSLDDVVCNLAEYAEALSDSREIPAYLAYYVLADNSLPVDDKKLNEQLAEQLEQPFSEWAEDVSFGDFAEALTTVMDVRSMLKRYGSPNRKGFFHTKLNTKNVFECNEE